MIKEVQRVGQYHKKTTDLHQLIRNIQNGHRSKFQRQVILAGIAALVYLICHSRNFGYWQQCNPSIICVVKQMKSVTKARIRAVLPKKIYKGDYEWFITL